MTCASFEGFLIIFIIVEYIPKKPILMIKAPTLFKPLKRGFQDLGACI